MMGLYVGYRELVAEYICRRRATRCEWCDGGWEGESEDEDEGYSEV